MGKSGEPEDLDDPKEPLENTINVCVVEVEAFIDVVAVEVAEIELFPWRCRGKVHGIWTITQFQQRWTCMHLSVIYKT